MLERFFALLVLFKEYVVFAALCVCSLILLTLNDNPQVRQLRSVATVMIGVVQDQLSFVPRYLRLAEENATLRRINIELADEASRLREAKLEALRLRRLLGLKQQSPFSLVAANVVGKHLTLLRNTLTLDVGRKDGVIPSMPVVNDAGLVGVVVSSSDFFSVVHILSNTDFRASVKVQRSRVDGILAWDGADLFIKNIAKTLDVQPGDVVITSEYSNTFPPGVRVGVVKSVEQQAGSLFQKVVVVPDVDFVRLEEVFVLRSVPNSERSRLERQAPSLAPLQ
jgi:rod shape-determining protein MreC